ncbi:MAG: asparaginase [Clostridiales bacterium]|nr:asparaginase [Clostridiales bacterium]
MKKILIIATGGTIASLPTENGLSPNIDSRQLVSAVPEIQEYCCITAIQYFNLDSTNMNHTHWLSIARYIRQEYDNYDGFVITHGTDTMAYASAIMSYLIQDSPKPVVFTGAQKSIFEKDTDARVNLINAVIYAADDRAHGVKLVFDGKVIVGTRARKTHTKSYNAFSSIDYPEVAVIRSGKLHYYIDDKTESTVKFFDKLNPNIIVLKLTPGMKAGVFDYIAENYDAVIIESFGMGGIPFYDSEEFADKIEMLINRDIRVIITTQVPHEGSDMEVYSVGFRVKKKYELLEAYDMTTETIVAKTMWALAESRDQQEFRRLFTTPVSKDIV